MNVPPTAKVTWIQGHGLFDRLEEPGSNLGTLGTRRVVYPLHHGGSYSGC